MKSTDSAPPPTLEDVPDSYYTDYAGLPGFFVFFNGKFCGWTRELAECQPGQKITPWRPGCIAITSRVGVINRWESTGGSYQSGADKWEKIS